LQLVIRGFDGIADPYSPVRKTSRKRQLRVTARAAIRDAAGGMALTQNRALLAFDAGDARLCP